MAELPPTSHRTPEEATPLPDPWIGRTIATYRILEKIGQGGMGVVYLAEHQSLERHAAIKFLAPQLASNKAYVDLFLREAKAAAKLSHPGIVAIYDAGKSEAGDYFFIMEYVKGRDLLSLLFERGVFAVPEAVSYVRQAARALSHAHEVGIIHRDIKPENLLLKDKTLKVADLGLAKWTGDSSGLMTQQGLVVGSPVYVAPERLRTGDRETDPRIDVYSLGASLFHLVTGKVPYDGTPAVMIAKHLNDPVPDPRVANPTLDFAIAGIIKKMMCKRIQDRFQTMDEVDAVLGEYEKACRQPVSVMPPQEAPPPRAAAKSRRPPPLAIVAALAAALALILIAPLKRAWPGAVARQQAVAFEEPAAGSLYTAWNSGPPASCKATIEPRAGPDGSAALAIHYNIPETGSAAGAKVQFPDPKELAGDTLSFEVKGDKPSTINFLIRLKYRATPQGPERLVEHVVREVSDSWKKVDVPLPARASLAEMTVVFDRKTTRFATGTVWLARLAVSTR